jgi:hypothetical protein
VLSWGQNDTSCDTNAQWAAAAATTAAATVITASGWENYAPPLSPSTTGVIRTEEGASAAAATAAANGWENHAPTTTSRWGDTVPVTTTATTTETMKASSSPVLPWGQNDTSRDTNAQWGTAVAAVTAVSGWENYVAPPPPSITDDDGDGSIPAVGSTPTAPAVMPSPDPGIRGDGGGGYDPSIWGAAPVTPAEERNLKAQITSFAASGTLPVMTRVAAITEELQATLVGEGEEGAAVAALHFPPTLSSAHRRMVHAFCEQMHLAHDSVNSVGGRQIVVRHIRKRNGTPPAKNDEKASDGKPSDGKPSDGKAKKPRHRDEGKGKGKANTAESKASTLVMPRHIAMEGTQQCPLMNDTSRRGVSPCLRKQPGVKEPTTATAPSPESSSRRFSFCPYCLVDALLRFDYIKEAVVVASKVRLDFHPPVEALVAHLSSKVLSSFTSFLHFLPLLPSFLYLLPSFTYLPPSLPSFTSFLHFLHHHYCHHHLRK